MTVRLIRHKDPHFYYKFVFLEQQKWYVPIKDILLKAYFCDPIS